MKRNYIIICLDSMFETFCVADEFVFLRFLDVFDISLPTIQFGCEVTTWVESIIVLWVLNCVCHISFCNVSRRIHNQFLFDISQSTCKTQIATANSKSLVYLFLSDQTLRPSRAISHLRHPSGWYSGALVVFSPAVIDIRSPSIQSDSLLQLRPILSKLVELAVEFPQICTSSFHNQVQLCRMEKVLDWSSIECPLSRAPLDKPDGVEPTKPRGAWRDALCITNHFLLG